MKKYIYQIFTIARLLFATQSCFQDLDNDPPFNFPEQPPLDPSGLRFYMSFDNNFEEARTGKSAAVVGSPTRVAGKKGQAYSGATNSYLTFNLSDFEQAPGSDFSVVFWYKVSATPDRAGIITISPPTAGAGANAQNNRTSGIRIFREGNNTRQVLVANIGNGTSDTWLNGGDAAAVNPATADWIFVALTVTNGRANFYLDGNVVSTGTPSGVSWDGCNILSIGSGAPRFTEWGHLSDQSLIDELRMFNKALSAEEIKEIMAY
jgi:hypothetical protein